MRVVVALAVVAAALSVAGWWTLLYAPAQTAQQALEAEEAALVQREQQLANQREQLLALQDRAPLIRQGLDRLSQLIPPDPDQATFLELLQLAGNASGVAFTSLSFSDPAPVADAPPTADPRLVLGSITVTGTIESGYFQLVDFLRRLEVEVPRAILVEQVDVVEGAAGFPSITTTFTAEMFALVPAPADPVDPTAPPDDPDGAPAAPTEGPSTPAAPTAPVDPLASPDPAGDDLPAVDQPDDLPAVDQPVDPAADQPPAADPAS